MPEDTTAMLASKVTACNEFAALLQVEVTKLSTATDLVVCAETLRDIEGMVNQFNRTLANALVDSLMTDIFSGFLP